MPKATREHASAWRWEEVSAIEGMTAADVAAFWGRVDTSGPCWPWQPSKGNQYGTVTIQGRSRMAHRIAYELVKGPIPKGKLLRHLCNYKACVNPDHLIPGSDTENARDRLLAERGAGYVARRDRKQQQQRERDAAQRQAEEARRQQLAAETRRELERFRRNDPDQFAAFVSALARDCEEGSYAALCLREELTAWGLI